MIDSAEWNEAREEFDKAMQALEQEQEEYWNSLTKQQQLWAFCAVARRIHKGELEDKGSYRYVLYQVFGFGAEAYVPAQLAGYLSLHNSIFDRNHETQLLEAFCTKLGIENAQEKISEFLS